MKYNKREQKAVDILANLAENLKNGEKTVLNAGDQVLLKNVLGISFAGTKSAGEVKEKYKLKRGKEELLMRRDFMYHGSAAEEHYYFPFQLKAK